MSPIIQKPTNRQLQQVRDAQRSVDSHREQQKIAKTPLTAQKVFDLCNLLSVMD